MINTADFLYLGVFLLTAAAISTLVWAVETGKWWTERLATILHWTLGIVGVLLLSIGGWLLIFGGA